MSDIFNRHIDDIEIPLRARTVLREAGVLFVSDLVRMNPSDLLKKKNFGKITMAWLEEDLELLGLRLGMTELVIAKPKPIPQKIALDYDQTYTTDPEMWDGFIAAARRRGHDIRIVTVRDERFDRTLPIIELEKSIEVIYTRGVAKRWFCERFCDDFQPDIWIDDRPQTIHANSDFTAQQLDEWRKSRGELHPDPQQ